MVKGPRELSGVSLIRALIPFMMALPSWPNHLPKTPFPHTVTFGVYDFNIWVLGRHKHLVYSPCYTAIDKLYMRKLNPRKVVWFEQCIKCKELKTQRFSDHLVREGHWGGGIKQISKWTEPRGHLGNKCAGRETGKGKCFVMRTLDQHQGQCGYGRAN